MLFLQRCGCIFKLVHVTACTSVYAGQALCSWEDQGRLGLSITSVILLKHACNILTTGICEKGEGGLSPRLYRGK